MKFALPDKFYVRTPNLELYKLVQIRLFELGYKWLNDSSLQDNLNYGEKHCIGVNPVKRMTYSPKSAYPHHSEVSVADLFLVETPKKETIINILPWKVVIHNGLVDIGCRKDIAIPFFQTMMNSIEGPDGISLDGYETKASRRGFQADKKEVSWRTWDEFVKAFNAATKED